MASTLEYVRYIAEQIDPNGAVTYKKMFGEYGLHFQGKYFACVCDNRFLVKITEAGKALMPGYKTALPYEGAKPMFLIEELDDREFLARLTEATCQELPAPKPKKKASPKEE